MTVPDNDNSPLSSIPRWQVPSIDSTDRMLGGVSGAIARELGVELMWVRISWVVLFTAGGWGAALYVFAWGFLSWMDYAYPPTVHSRSPKGRTSETRLLGFALAVTGLAGLFLGFVGLNQGVLWPLGLIGLGFLISWRRFGPTAIDRERGRYPMAQAVAGLVISAFGAMLLVFVSLGANSTAALLYLLIFVAVAAVLATSPWWWRFVQNLDQERQAKALSDERAEVAAHLHDSVLQTLSLIQRNSDDPQVMLNLARRQERELRNWLDPDRASRVGGSVRGHLDVMASEIEELYATPVELVVVGDCLVDDAVEQTLAAAREAVVNSAKHGSGVDGQPLGRIDVYVEIKETEFEVFIRDRGVGFDLSQVGADRRGIRESIQARMSRAGGSSVVDSVVGEGTEVQLVLPRSVVAEGPTNTPPQ